ncbi:MAG: hypothetical protein LW821_02360 [Flammeovirgaceae bacterium]|jgi:hypothetical protein|nr:hypothetical protein [Flammeovirgaceae bacterium]
MEIPRIILESGGNQENWCPEHDLYVGTVQKEFYDSTQLIWWQTNVKIRRVLNEIENEIKSAIKLGLVISDKKLSYVELSKRTELTRVTLTHKDRKEWINSRRKSILKQLVKKDEKKINNELSKLKNENKDLKRRLSLQRDESIRLLERIAKLNEEINILRGNNMKKNR